jgi:hypothetical protein
MLPATGDVAQPQIDPRAAALEVRDAVLGTANLRSLMPEDDRAILVVFECVEPFPRDPSEPKLQATLKSVCVGADGQLLKLRIVDQDACYG